MSLDTPWAVLFCKFKDDLRSFATINLAETKAMFVGSDSESIPAYWQDVSYGALDLGRSEAFGWLTLEQNHSDFVAALLDSPPRRQDLVTWARKAASDAGIDLSPFYGVAVFMSTPGTDLWGMPNTVVCSYLHPMPVILQEYGHGYGLLNHSRAVSTPTDDYTNPVCVMSSMKFGGADPTYPGRFGKSGPMLCSPYIDIAGWLSPGRIQTIQTVRGKPKLTTMRLSPLGDRTAPHPQVARFDFDRPYRADYYIEYRAGGWDRGITLVAIHQRRPDGYCYYAGGIPIKLGTSPSWVDPDFDLSVRLRRILDSESSVEITVGPRAAVLGLSVRQIAAAQLNLTGALTVRGQILQSGDSSLRKSLLTLLDR